MVIHLSSVKNNNLLDKLVHSSSCNLENRFLGGRNVLLESKSGVHTKTTFIKL